MKNYHPKGYTGLLNKHTLTREIELEAAMCAWEHLIETKPNNWPEGLGQLRLCAGAIASAIHYGWVICTNGTDEYLYGAYDWDFVPWFIENCVIFDNQQAYVHGTPDLVSNWIELCIAHNKPTAEGLLGEARYILDQYCKTEIVAKIDAYFREKGTHNG